MFLWETNSGDRWLCGQCREECSEMIKQEGWQLLLEKIDPELQCVECGNADPLRDEPFG